LTPESLGFDLVSPAGLYRTSSDCLNYDVEDALQTLQRRLTESHTGINCFPIAEAMCSLPALKLAKPG